MYAPAKPRAKRAKNFFEVIFSVCGGGGGRKPFVGGVKGTCGGGYRAFCEGGLSVTQRKGAR